MFTGERGGRDRRKNEGTVEMVVEGRIVEGCSLEDELCVELAEESRR